MNSAASLLEIKALRVSFGGFQAIDGLDLDVREGELRFLIGPNGAGKTTLIDAMTGLSRASGGSIRFCGEELTGKKEHDIVRLGVGRSFQTPTVFEELSVVENVDLAASYRMRLWSMLRRRKGVGGRVASALEEMGLSGHASRPAGTLSHGQKQWLEIAMLLVQDPRLLLLDEPVAGMSKEERTKTGELLQKLAETRTVIVVEHDMEFLRRFATKVTVMHEGKILCEGTVSEVQSDPIVQEVYLGRAHERRSLVEAAQ